MPTVTQSPGKSASKAARTLREEDPVVLPFKRRKERAAASAAGANAALKASREAGRATLVEGYGVVMVNVREGAYITGAIKRAYDSLGPVIWAAHEHDDLLMHETIVKGVNVGMLLNFMRAYKGFTADELAPALRVSKRTFSRLTEDESTILNVSQSEGLVGLVQSVRLGTEVFGSESATLEWFKKPAIGLDGKRPMELLSTSFGTKLVLDLLTRIKYGVYS
jgi:putative toxin-antitoxin system antitoxin component (TIGR02293 family)